MPAPAIKANKIAEILRKRIDDGVYVAQLPSMTSLAGELGVNGRTVMKGLASLEADGLVSRIPGHGTFVTRLKRRRSGIIGTIMGDTHAPLGSQLARGIQQAADQAGQSVTTNCYLHQYDTQLPRLHDMVERTGIDGLILWLSDSDTQAAATEYLNDKNMPFVLIPEPDLKLFTKCHTVSNAGPGAAQDVMTHLLGLGHRKIVFIDEIKDEHSTFHRHRYEQYCRSMKIAGLSPFPVLSMMKSGNSNDISSLNPEIPDLLKEYTAAFCETDRVAAMVYRVCAGKGLRIPDDLSVAGYDNTTISELLDMTSVEQHFEQIGRRAVEILAQDLDGNAGEPVHESVESELIIRGSTGKLNQ